MAALPQEKKGNKKSDPKSTTFPVLMQEAEKHRDKWETIGEWLNDHQGSTPFRDFLTNIGYTLNETFKELASGSSDSYFIDIAKDNKIIGKIPQSFQAMVNDARGT